MSTQFSTDFPSTLPAGQSFIHTTSTDKAFSAYNTLRNASSSTSRIALITGVAGIGKSAIMQELLTRQQPRSETMIPAEIGLRVRPQATPQVLYRDIIEMLNEKPRRRWNGFAAMSAAVEALNYNKIDLVILDAGERLRAPTFKAIQELHDRTNSRFIILGLPELLKKAQHQEEFTMRIGFKLELQPLAVEEVLNTVLPQMHIPCWYFNPDDEHHRTIGGWLWETVQPSLRRLYYVIKTASMVATRTEESRISEDHLKLSMELTLPGYKISKVA